MRSACYGGGAITIVVCGHKVTINANILLIAPDGYDEQFIESAIKKYYEGVFYGDDDYFDVSVNLTFFSPETQCDDSIVIKIIDDCGTSYTHGKYLKNHWQLNKIGLIVAYTHWSNGELKNDFDWTIAHEFTHALNIPDQRDSNSYLFGGSTIMESRGGLMTYKVIKLIIKTFKTNRGYGWE